MSCRNPNIDGCMANDTQSYTETFSNENSNDSGYWSDYQETPKIYGKNDYPSEFLCNSCYADRQKVSGFFFFKNEWSLNQFQCNFKSSYLYISIFFQISLCFSVKNTQKCTSLKLYLKNQFIFSLPNSFRSTGPKSRLPQRRKQISPARL